MDIFTTQLTKVRQQPIRPDKLRVKSLTKDAKARPLNEENDHLTGETQSPDLHISHYQHDDENDREKPQTASKSDDESTEQESTQQVNQKVTAVNPEEQADNDMAKAHKIKKHIDLFV